MVRRKKIVFIHQTWKGFERADYEILKKHYRVVDAHLYRNFWYKTFFLAWDILSCDVVFCWFAYRAAVPALALARLARKRIVVVAGGWEAADEPDFSYGAMRKGHANAMTRAITNRIMAWADAVVASSEFNRKEVCARCGVDERKVVAIYLGVAPCPPDGAVGEKDPTMVLTVGEVTRTNMARKGIGLFLEAAAILAGARFVIIGSKQALLRYAPGPLPPNVEVHEYAPDRVHAYYRTAKVYAQLSLHENFGLALAEAMAYGCVPVVTSKGALPEVAGETGWYVPSPEAAEAARVIAQALADKVRGPEARRRVERLFGIERREAALVRLIETIGAGVRAA